MEQRNILLIKSFQEYLEAKVVIRIVINTIYLLLTKHMEPDEY
jgi:hypothetical protein